MNKNLLYRFFEGHASIEEMKQIKEWAESSEENLRVLYQERKLFDAGQILGSMPMQAAPRKSKARQVGLWREWLKIAAVVAVTFSLTTTWFIFTNHRTAMAMQTITVPSGQRVNILLPDSTDVWLNAGTTFSYPTTFGTRQREVELDGEAYFEVTPNARRPFIVEVDGAAAVRVLGTSFDVKAYASDPTVDVVLLEGSVEFSQDALRYRLEPSQKLTFDKATRRGVVTVLEDAARSVLWSRNVICFRDAPLSQVVAELERWYDVRIEVTDPEAYRLSFSFYTASMPLPDLLRELESIAPIRCELAGQSLRISMKRD